MAMYDAKPIPTRQALDRPALPVLAVGDRVRIANLLSVDEPLQARDGAYGIVMRFSGNRVVVELDERYQANGVRQRLFHSFVEELEVVPRVGRMGAVDLYADDQVDAGGEP